MQPVGVSGKKNIACFSLFVLMSLSQNTAKSRIVQCCKYDQTPYHPDHYVSIFVMFLYCYPQIVTIPLVEGLTFTSLLQLYTKSISHLKLSSQYTLRHVLQYHTLSNISSFTNLEQVFTKYPTHLDPLARMEHLVVYIFPLNPCRESSYLSNVSLQ